MTGHSGHGRKSVTFNQNWRSHSIGTTGHVQSESAVKLTRNTQDPRRLIILGLEVAPDLDAVARGEDPELNAVCAMVELCANRRPVRMEN
jgi:hypothetical protein